jgi:hypothetical protein
MGGYGGYGGSGSGWGARGTWGREELVLLIYLRNGSR